MPTGGAAPSSTAAPASAREPRQLVVVGHGPISHAFLKSLLQSPVEDHVTVLCEEPRPAYDRVRLTEYLQDRDGDKGDRMRLSLVSEAELRGRGVRLVYGRGTAIDRQAKLVTVAAAAGAAEQLPYHALVLATGSSCFIPPVPGLSLPHKANPLWPDDPASRPPGVFVYRTIEDLDGLTAAVERGASKAAVIGGGLLGLEAAGALRDLGLDCCVLESAPHLLSSQLNRAAGDMLAKKVADLGLLVYTEAVLDEVLLQGGRASGVRFHAAGASVPSTVDVDIVIVAAGVRPRDELARGCGLELGQRGGVKVDGHLRSSDPSIFAIGEVAAIDGGMCYGLWAPGVEQAGVLARVLSEGPGAARYERSDLSTDLKLASVSVASFGCDGAFWSERQFDDGAQGVRHEDLQDEEAGVYKRLCLSADSGRLLGGILLGDTRQFGALLGICRKSVPGALDLDSLLRGGADDAGARAPEAWLRVGHVSELDRAEPRAEGGWQALPFVWEGADCAAMVRDGVWVAFARACPHAGIDMYEGDIEDLGGGPVLSCPAHAYLFDCRTGACLWDSALCQPAPTPAMAVFDVEDRDGDIWVRPRKGPAVERAAWSQEEANALQMDFLDIVLTRKFPD